jgi:hypothetical protein
MTIGNKHTNPRTQAERAEREIKAFDMLLAGATYEQISNELGYGDKSNAHKAMKIVLQRRMRERDDVADLALTMMIERIEGMLRVYYPKALDGDLKAAEFVLKTLDREAKLMGLDAPTRVDATVVTVTETDLEIQHLTQRLLSGAAERGIEIDPAKLPTLTALANPEQPTADED